MHDNLADRGVVLEDITTVKAADLGEDIAGYLAGFPCQAGFHDVSPVTGLLCNICELVDSSWPGDIPCREPRRDVRRKKQSLHPYMAIVG